MSKLPDGWESKTLGEIVDENRPITYGIVQAGPHIENGIPYIRVSDMTKGYLTLEGMLRTSHEIAKSYRRSTVQTNDLVFALRGSPGLVLKVPEGLNGANLTQGTARISSSGKVIADFLLQAMQSKAVKTDILQRIKGSTFQEITLTELAKVKVPLPPLEEQWKIAAILSTWDEAIGLVEALIGALGRRKQALMQLLLTGAVRFAGFEGAGEYQDTEFGQIPADWDYAFIGDIAESVSERNAEDIELPVLSCTKYEGLVDSLKYFGKQIYSDDLSTYKVVRKNQFAYATNHIEEGSIGYQNLYDSALISPMYTVFQANEKVFDPFLYSVLKTDLYKYIFQINTSASVDRRGSLRWPQFSRIRVPLPSIQEQQAISKVLETEQELLSRNHDLLAGLREQKRGLMQQLLTGAVRV
ncbi:MAG: restriction endonuclease subunit S [Chloroflexi bacterium]|nr:restriction endonuclease subunit S [Chloroflexota bacterium]